MLHWDYILSALCKKVEWGRSTHFLSFYFSEFVPAKERRVPLGLFFFFEIMQLILYRSGFTKFTLLFANNRQIVCLSDEKLIQFRPDSSHIRFNFSRDDESTLANKCMSKRAPRAPKLQCASRASISFVSGGKNLVRCQLASILAAPPQKNIKIEKNIKIKKRQIYI